MSDRFLGRGVRKINELVLEEGRYLILEKEVAKREGYTAKNGTIAIDTETGEMTRKVVPKEDGEHPYWTPIPYVAYEVDESDQAGLHKTTLKVNGENFLRLTQEKE